MNIIVKPPRRFSFFTLCAMVLGNWVVIKVIKYYSLREYMRRVRERNDLMKLQHAEVKTMDPPTLEDLNGEPILLENVPGDYLFVFTGDFHSFLKVKGALGESLFFKDMKFLFITDRERLRKIVTEAMRAPLSDT